MCNSMKAFISFNRWGLWLAYRGFALPRFEIPSISVALDRLWWFLRALLYSVIAYYALSALCQFAGVFYNYSPSMPKSVYAYYPALSVHYGDTVVVHPNSTRPSVQVAIARDYVLPHEKWLKSVVGVAGDTIKAHGRVITIEHNGLKRTITCLKSDTTGRSLQCADFSHIHIIPQGEFFLQGTGSNESYDSRYLGLVSISEITNKAVRL